MNRANVIDCNDRSSATLMEFCVPGVIHVGTTSTVQVAVQKPKEEIKVPDVKVGDKVNHKTFGEGTISFMDKAQKKIRVQFHVGEKMFLYPDAFVNGHLSV